MKLPSIQNIIRKSTNNDKKRKFHLKRIHLLALIASLSIPAVFVTALSGNAVTEPIKTPIAEIMPNAADRITSQLDIPTPQETKATLATETETPNNIYKTLNITVKKGDTLTHIFRRAGLSAQHAHRIAQLSKKTKTLTRLTPGQSFDFNLNSNNELRKLTYHISKTRKLIIKKNNKQFQVFNEERAYETRVSYTTGTINTSLFNAASKAGLSDNLTMDLAHIFGWDIDFALDIRAGDSFTVVYESLYLDGERVRDGNILAAEFINQKNTFKAVRYTDKTNNSSYYSETGRSMRKAFLRSPVDFTRISSRFGKRHHPTLKKWKSHKGVDYAASRGTPIKAAGDGKITWRARKGGYGKTVIIKHGSRYSTLYAHMSNYNRKAKMGSRVKQGQVIGYVGTTGRSTGPHLHYEFRVNGTHHNPLTVKLPNAASIKKKYRQDFFSKSRSLLAQLDLVKNTRIALNEL